MNQVLRRNLELYYPMLLEKAVDIREIDIDELLLILEDGERYIYDDDWKGIRRMPRDPDDISEQECRNEFGRKLNKLLRRSGVTQIELSDITGLSQVTISNYITGKASPSFYNVDKIAKALKCSVDEFRYIL